jgi:hypothetical protein
MSAKKPTSSEVPPATQKRALGRESEGREAMKVSTWEVSEWTREGGLVIVVLRRRLRGRRYALQRFGRGFCGEWKARLGFA